VGVEEKRKKFGHMGEINEKSEEFKKNISL